MKESQLIWGGWRWRLVMATLVVAVACCTCGGAAACDLAGLPDYPTEAGLLVDTPGTSGSVAAGLFNPAAWPLQREGRLFLAWDDLDGSDKSNWTAVLSGGRLPLAFGWRRLYLGPRDSYTGNGTFGRESRIDDYSIGFGSRTAAGAVGISYSWGSGDIDQVPRHERMTLGHISRWRQASLGLSETLDLESRNNFFQLDLGIRPIGPRFTLFGDAVYGHGDSFDDIRTGYGVEARPIPGLAVAAKVQNTGEFSFRVGVDLSRDSRISYRPHFDDDSDISSSTYSIEVGGDHPEIGHGHRGVRKAYPEMHLRGRTSYRRYRFFDNRRTLMVTLKQIARYADNPRVGGVVVNLSGMGMSPEMAWEIATQLEGLRARGKKVIVYFDRVSLVGCAMASVADQVWIDPSGMIDVTGISTGRTYYKKALEKMGVGFDEWRFFTYKSALESFSRDSLSEPDREQRQAIIDDIYETAADMIASSRGISRAQLDELVNEKGILLPDEAQAAELVDSIGTFHEAKKAAKEAEGRATHGQFAAVLDGVLGDDVWGPQEWGDPPAVAVLYAIGPCDMDSGIKGRLLAKKIRAARENPAVKAIVFRADSPGGDALPSDLVARELKETSKTKPVIVSQGQVAGSGGYWISMYGDTIVAAPVTITGSIGVIGGWFWNKELGEKIGLDYDGVKRGEHADLGAGIRIPLINAVVPERPLTQEERGRMEHLIRTMYKEFVGKVAEGRGLGEDEVDSIGQGRVWSGTRGLEIGLVDELGGLWRSLQIAKEAAGIPADDPILITEGPDLGLFNLGGLMRPSFFGVEEPGQDQAVEKLLSEAELTYVRHLLRSRGTPLLMMEPIEIIDGIWQE